MTERQRMLKNLRELVAWLQTDANRAEVFDISYLEEEIGCIYDETEFGDYSRHETMRDLETVLDHTLGQVRHDMLNVFKRHLNKKA